MGWSIDTKKPLWELIESKILKNYRFIHSDITQVTNSNNIYHALMSGLATGDGREHSAFKKAKLSRSGGEHAVDFLIHEGLLQRESSILKAANAEEEVSDRIHFLQPFRRFWFASISPYYRGIKAGDFSEVKQKYEGREQGFSDLIYQQLFKELVRSSFKEDPVEKIGSYWDKRVEIDLIARTKSGKVIAGLCKVSNTKSKKSDLAKLTRQCEEAQIKPDVTVLFSKSGFSNELKSEKGEALRLFTLKSFKTLIEDLSESDLIEPVGKRY